ncbi:MAG: hypothetical protein ABIP49_08230 [Lysobacterales bacterium]
MRSTCALAGLLVAFAAYAQAPRDYDMVYVRQARYGDNLNTTWPEVFHPARLDPGADLMLLHPNGTEEVLVAGGNGGVTDPFVSFDGASIYYSLFPDLRPQSLNPQRDNLPLAGADVYRMVLATRQITRLTFGEFTPNTGAGNWDESNPVDPPAQFNRLGYGILNLGPSPLPGGRIAFTSNRNGFEPPKGFTNPTLQLFVMDADGQNVTPIAPMNISSALHPTILRDGRIMFSSHEDQGIRDQRLWGIWAIKPDGRTWEPLLSAFRGPQAFHFMTQLGNEDIVVVDYYNLNNNGFGALYRFPIRPPPGQPNFHSAFAADNPLIARTVGQGFRFDFTMPFTPRGLFSLTPFTHGDDEAAPIGAGGARVGKFTHPSAAPANDLLVAWTPGPANDLDRPTNLPSYDSGIYIAPGGNIINAASNLVLVKNDPLYNEAWPRAVVPYSRIHGVAEPANLPWLPNSGTLHALLPAGTPFGLIGTSSFYKRESFPGYAPPFANTFNGLDPFNTSENDQSSNWFTQGSDAGRYGNADIWAVRIVAMEPNTHRSYGPNEGRQFSSHAQERLRILGEIPLRKTNGQGQPLLDAEGNPDTSFLAKMVADTPFTFQTLDRNGMALNIAQTWHQVRPGELRADCGGCHAHSQQPLAFESTAAAGPGHAVYDLSRVTPLLTRSPEGETLLRIEDASAVNVEFLRDIRPVLQRACVSCHQGASPAGNLDLSATGTFGGLPGDYFRLAADTDAQFGHAPVIVNRQWRQTNASRYVRMFQSRRSLLMWKLFGQRLDGWSNADHQTETVPGNAATLPAGANRDQADIDYTGTIMPPPPAAPLTADEKINFARWIDLGAPIDIGNVNLGWTLDDLRPALTLSTPRPGTLALPVTHIRLGLADANSGINLASLSVTSDRIINGRPPGSELSDLAQPSGDGMFAITLSTPFAQVTNAHVRASVRDNQGNVTRIDRAFSVLAAADGLFLDSFE